VVDPARADAQEGRERSIRGAWSYNPVTGELGHLLVAPEDTGGRRIEVELWLQPGAAVVGAHTHDSLVERFEVLEGQVTFQVGDEERAVGPGDGVAEVGAGVVHDWWNSGEEIARVRVEVEAVSDAPGEPAARFVSMIEAAWSLGALGKTDEKGMPGPLWLGAIGHEYRDVIRFTKPPRAVQAIVFPVLAALARASGRDPLAPELHGPGAPLEIDDPGEGIEELLARRVDARAARGRG